MRVTSDWFRVPPEFRSRLPRVSGIRGPEVHLSHLPLLPPDIRGLAKPLYEREVADDVPWHLLRPYQERAARFCRGREGSILALDMGLGKTRTSLVASWSPGKVGVIVAPLVAFGVWLREIAVVYGSDYPVTVVRGRRLADDGSLERPGIYLLNPEIVRHRWSEWISVRPEFVLLDEAHLYVRERTRRHHGAQSLAGIAKMRIALTGTPILRHVVDLHGILRCVCPSAFGGWVEFALENGGRPGSHGIELGKPTPDQVALLERRLSQVMVQMRWREVIEDVPPITREKVDVRLPPREAQEYNRLARDIRKILGDRVTYEGLLRAAAMVEVGALRRFVGRAKVGAVADLVCGTDDPVVVWAWHRDVAEAIAEKVRGNGSEAVVLHGGIAQSERDAVIAAFQRRDGPRVLCATMAAVGLGVDLTRARYSVFAELDWTPAVMAQSERRVWRSGQEAPCVTYWVVVPGSVEDRVLEILLQKDEFARADVLPGIAPSDSASSTEEMVEFLDLVLG